jgi:ABC-2 type transport system permease protein
MNTVETRGGKSLGEHVRITWAIAAKDIIDALKNRTTLTNIILVFIMMVVYRMMMPLIDADAPTRLFVYDAGDSNLVEALKRSRAVRVYTFESQEIMLEKIQGSDADELGLVIPAESAQTLDAGQSLELEGYTVYFAGGAALDELVARVERVITEQIGQPVHIRLNAQRLYPEPGSAEIGALPMTAVMALFFALIMIGITVVPLLMIEEKETKTLDALLVSPAQSGHLVVGKALAGLFYCLSAAVIVLVFNATLINSWDIAITVVILGSLLTVALGLLLGSLCQVKQQYMIWAMALMVILFLPIFLITMREILPEVAGAILPWLPTAALAKASWTMFARTAPWSAFGLELILVMVYIVLILLVVSWIVRRSAR